MKSVVICVMSAFLLTFSGCSNAEDNLNPTINNSDATNESVKLPFEFPAMATSANAGETILCPSFEQIANAGKSPASKIVLAWYNQKMINPGPETSEVQFTNETKRIPNAYIISIPPGAKAKKADILLTWWQSGSAMKRAIVVDDENPTEPVVRYLDIAYENLTKSPDESTTLGKMNEKLAPDTFIVLKNEMEPGTVVAIQDGEKLRHGQVINTSGEKVLVKKFGSQIGVYSKAECQPVPLVPNIKVNSRIKALRTVNFEDAIVTNIDSKIGRVFVKFDGGSKEEKAVAFGDVLPN